MRLLASLSSEDRTTFSFVNCNKRTFQKSFALFKQLGYSQFILTGKQRHQVYCFNGLFDDSKLLLGGTAPAALRH
jgi:hypothetical protein